MESWEWAALSGCRVTLNSSFSTLNLLTSQLREMTAWAFSSSKEAVALISDEITLVRYSSMEITLMAVSCSPSMIIFNSPLNFWTSLRSQWKLIPMVTSFSSKKACPWTREAACRGDGRIQSERTELEVCLSIIWSGNDNCPNQWNGYLPLDNRQSPASIFVSPPCHSNLSFQKGDGSLAKWTDCSVQIPHGHTHRWSSWWQPARRFLGPPSSYTVHLSVTLAYSCPFRTIVHNKNLAGEVTGDGWDTFWMPVWSFQRWTFWLLPWKCIGFRLWMSKKKEWPHGCDPHSPHAV